MKKKGFTLIELLAVIVILAVIALIATPAVLNIIEDSKKSAAEASARSIASAAKTYYLKTIMDKGTIGEVDLSTDTLKYDGEQAKKGVLSYDTKGNVVGKMYISGYCIEVKNDGSIVSVKVDEEDCSISSPKPTPTDLSCFTIEETTITDYKCYEGNTYGFPTITDVVIPNIITKIGEVSFASKKLTSVVIPNSVVDIERAAFASNKITSIEIPDSVTTIGVSAFAQNKLTNVIIGNGVMIISSGTFAANQITDVIISDSVTSIESGSFSSNQLTNVTIPNSVKSIDAQAFVNNPNLKTITIDNSEGSISGSPWGAENATIKYLR